MSTPLAPKLPSAWICFPDGTTGGGRGYGAVVLIPSCCEILLKIKNTVSQAISSMQGGGFATCVYDSPFFSAEYLNGHVLYYMCGPRNCAITL
jgi:hypothetical protein